MSKLFKKLLFFLQWKLKLFLSFKEAVTFLEVSNDLIANIFDSL